MSKNPLLFHCDLHRLPISICWTWNWARASAPREAIYGFFLRQSNFLFLYSITKETLKVRCVSVAPVWLQVLHTVMISPIANHLGYEPFEPQEDDDRMIAVTICKEEGIDFGHLTHDLLIAYHTMPYGVHCRRRCDIKQYNYYKNFFKNGFELWIFFEASQQAG